MKTGERGEILTDCRRRTANARIWAAGDVTGGPQFVYVAAQGSPAAANALQGAGWHGRRRGPRSRLRADGSA